MKLASVLALAAVLSGCNSAHLVTTRDIKAGEVIQASDLATDHHYKGLWNPEDWGWATPWRPLEGCRPQSQEPAELSAAFQVV